MATATAVEARVHLQGGVVVGAREEVTRCTKIDELYPLGLTRDDHVRALDIPVHDTPRMQAREIAEDLAADLADQVCAALERPLAALLSSERLRNAEGPTVSLGQLANH